MCLVRGDATPAGWFRGATARSAALSAEDGHRPLQTDCAFASVRAFLRVRTAGRTESSAPTATGVISADPHWCIPICGIVPHDPFVTASPRPYVTTKWGELVGCQTFCRICLLFCANGQAKIGTFLLTTGAGVCYNPDDLSDTPREVLREGALRYAEPPHQQLHDGHDDVHLHGDVQPLACAESGMSFVVPGCGLNRTKERLLGWKRRRFQPFLICGGNCFD